MLGAVPGQSCSVFWTCYRLLKEQCRAELQQMLEEGVSEAFGKGKITTSP